MKTLSTLALALATSGLFGQAPDRDLDARIQFFVENCRPQSVTVAQVPNSVKDQASNQTGVGIRFMGEFASAAGFYYEIGGKSESSSRYGLNGFIGSNTSLNLQDVKFTDSYWSLGVAYMTQPNTYLTFGLHLEGRGEAIRAQGEVFQDQGAGYVSMGMLDASTTYLRPWVRLSGDVTLPVGKYHPYLGLDVSYTPVKTTQTRLVPLVQMDNRTLEAMAPTAAVAFYFGLRF